MKNITKILLNIERKARKYFEHFPFTHAALAGVGVVLFWRGVWETADILQLSPVWSIILGALLLGGLGVFIQTFVGNTIIIKRVEKEEKSEEEIKKDVSVVGKEIRKEEITLEALDKKLQAINQKLDSLNK